MADLVKLVELPKIVKFVIVARPRNENAKQVPDADDKSHLKLRTRIRRK